MPTPEEGKLEVNKQYQETIKIVINLVTASLVLPMFGMYTEKEKKLGKQPGAIEHQMENWRDVMALIAAPSAVAGLVCLLIFFV